MKYFIMLSPTHWGKLLALRKILLWHSFWVPLHSKLSLKQQPLYNSHHLELAQDDFTFNMLLS